MSNEAQRAAFLDQLNVVTGATYYRLCELDRKYREAASDDPMAQARHTAVRYELERRGYVVTQQ